LLVETQRSAFHPCWGQITRQLLGLRYRDGDNPIDTQFDRILKQK